MSTVEVRWVADGKENIRRHKLELDSFDNVVTIVNNSIVNASH